MSIKDLNVASVTRDEDEELISSLNVKIPEELHAEIRIAAAKSRMTLRQYVIATLQAAVERAA